MATSYEAQSYLRSGTNELKILEYVCGGVHFGINILKTSRILNLPPRLTRIAGAHHSVLGIFHNLGVNLPVIDLVAFLSLDYRRTEEEMARRRVIVTEFFGQHNSFVIDRVERIQDFSWQNVRDSHQIMNTLGSAYVLGIVNREDKEPILMLDYERIILDINPDAAQLAVPTDTAVIKPVEGKKIARRRRPKITPEAGHEADIVVAPPKISAVLSPTEPEPEASAAAAPPEPREESTTAPLSATEVPEQKIAPEIVAPEPEPEPDLGPPTILVAEDSLTVRNLIVNTLAAEGYEVLSAPDGVQAKTLFDAHPEIAMVLTDVEMPQMDGLSLTQAIRQVDPDVPIILHSSIGDMGMKERARAVSANSHITKFNMEELLRVTAEFMSVYQ
jgi:chemotaxis signal transduction protein